MSWGRCRPAVCLAASGLPAQAGCACGQAAPTATCVNSFRATFHTTPPARVQIYEGGRGLGFHFDKDEHAMREAGSMVNPALSSVLYLTGSQSDVLRQVCGASR